MNKPQPRGVVKQAKILDVAAALFAEHGYEHTTLALVASASGAAIGSIEHFFGKKPDLAKAVYEDVVGRLVAVIDRALMSNRYDRSDAVRALLQAYFRWATSNPHHRRVLEVLIDHAAAFGPTEATGVQARVEPVLLNWATPLIKAGKVRPLTAAQLFALIVAPAMASPVSTNDLDEAQVELTQGWPSTLASIVIQAIAQPISKQASGPKNKGDGKAKAPTPPTPRGDLFS